MKKYLGVFYLFWLSKTTAMTGKLLGPLTTFDQQLDKQKYKLINCLLKIIKEFLNIILYNKLKIILTKSWKLFYEFFSLCIITMWSLSKIFFSLLIFKIFKKWLSKRKI